MDQVIRDILVTHFKVEAKYTFKKDTLSLNWDPPVKMDDEEIESMMRYAWICQLYDRPCSDPIEITDTPIKAIQSIVDGKIYHLNQNVRLPKIGKSLGLSGQVPVNKICMALTVFFHPDRVYKRMIEKYAEWLDVSMGNGQTRLKELRQETYISLDINFKHTLNSLGRQFLIDRFDMFKINWRLYGQTQPDNLLSKYRQALNMIKGKGGIKHG